MERIVRNMAVVTYSRGKKMISTSTNMVKTSLKSSGDGGHFKRFSVNIYAKKLREAIETVYAVNCLVVGVKSFCVNRSELMCRVEWVVIVDYTNAEGRCEQFCGRFYRLLDFDYAGCRGLRVVLDDVELWRPFSSAQIQVGVRAYAEFDDNC